MNIWTHFGGMTWPVPNDDMGELEWRLRNAESIEPTDRLAAASVVAAYGAMVQATQAKRQMVIRNIRATLDKEKHRE